MEDFSQELIDVSQGKAWQIFSVYEAMSITATSYALSVHAHWPFVTINHFEKRGQQLLELSGADYVGLLPYVRHDQLVEWERWSIDHQGWISPETFAMYPFMNGTISPKVYNFFTQQSYEDEDLGQAQDNNSQEKPEKMWYAPVWQTAPALPFYTNADMYQPFLVNKLNTSRTVSMTDLTQVSFHNASSVLPEDESLWPLAIMSAPIFEDFNEAPVNDNDLSQPRLVAQFMSLFPMHNIFKSVLPMSLSNVSMLVVITNTCNQTVTYQVNGPNVKWISVADVHDERYDDMVYSRTLDLADSACEYTANVYPSYDMEQAYHTNKPKYYTSVVVVVFAMTSLVFLWYDVLVQRRQDTVMTSAQRTNAIVSNLFPAEFRDRLIKEQQQKEENKRLSDVGNKNGRKSSRHDDMGGLLSLSSSGGALNLSSKPLADFHPNATLMFADIVGKLY